MTVPFFVSALFVTSRAGIAARFYKGARRARELTVALAMRRVRIPPNVRREKAEEENNTPLHW
jgi:hypothetical protein